MRVLAIGNMYPPHHLGGYELVWQAAVRGLRDAGHGVRVLTTDYRSPERGARAEEEPDVHRELRWYWSDHGFPRRGLRERLRIERHNGEVLDRHLRELDPGVVTWWSMGGMSLSMIERVQRAGVPAVGFVHDEWMSYGPRVDAWSRAFARPRPLALAVERVTGVPAALRLGSAARWLFNSEAMRRSAAERRLADTGVVYPGVDLGLFRPEPEHSWSGRLLYVGRIDARKGIDTAIRALAGLDGASLVVCGAGDAGHLSELRELGERLGLSNRVRFEHHPRGDLPKLYAEADAVLFPVRWEEPFGLVPLEAMAVGTPVVATGSGGSAEYLRDGENCLLFRPRGDPAALAAAVERLAGDPGLRARLRRLGFDTAAGFDQCAFVRRVVEEVERAPDR